VTQLDWFKIKIFSNFTDLLNRPSEKRSGWLKVNQVTVDLQTFWKSVRPFVWVELEREIKKGKKVSISSTFLRTNFSYEHHFGSFSSFGFGKKFVRKMRAFNVDEIDGRSHNICFVSVDNYLVNSLRWVHTKKSTIEKSLSKYQQKIFLEKCSL